MAPPSRSRPTSSWAGTAHCAAHRLDLACALADVRATRLSFHARNRTLSRYARTHARAHRYIFESLLEVVDANNNLLYDEGDTAVAAYAQLSARNANRPSLWLRTVRREQPSRRTCAVSRTDGRFDVQLPLTPQWTYPTVCTGCHAPRSHTRLAHWAVGVR